MWSPGEIVIRREVVNDGRAWMCAPVIVVVDRADLLATYIAEGTPFEFPDGDWRAPDGVHPWHGRQRWQGQGLLMLQRPGDAYAIWLFWHGPEREFRGWYVNLQEPFRRTAAGYDTQDLELDIWVPLDGPWQWKDDELLDQRVREGRFTAGQAVEIRAVGASVAADLDAGRRWWSDDWASWKPDPAW
jgi:hypothetical protein